MIYKNNKNNKKKILFLLRKSTKFWFVRDTRWNIDIFRRNGGGEREMNGGDKLRMCSLSRNKSIKTNEKFKNDLIASIAGQDMK